ncbi:MAG: DUF881 domain-containing protein [Nocardioides sp.]
MPDLDTPASQSPSAVGGRPGAGGRGRLLQAFLRPARGQFVVAVLMVALGFAAATQVRSTNEELYAGYRDDELIEVLRGLTGATQRAQDDLAALQETNQQLQDTTASRRAALEEAQLRVDNYNILAGLVPVKGPGIAVTIDEQTAAVSSDSLLNLIEEMRSVGAEAIEVNNQIRLVASSWIDQVPGAIVFDGVELAAPYTIEAIGEPETLEGAVVFTRGPKDELEDAGASVLVEQLVSVRIESVTAQPTSQYAQPTQAQ